jgi:hypothetical protein
MGRQHHRPQHALEAEAGNQVAADQAADGQRDDADGAIGNADLRGGQAQAALGQRVLQEGNGELEQLRFAQAEGQDEAQDQQDVLLAEEGGEGGEEVAQGIVARADVDQA